MHLDFSPTHLHLALNYVPITGTALSCLPIIIGILVQCRTTIAVGLLSTLLCAAVMPAIMQTGHGASLGFKEGKVLPPLDEIATTARHAHEMRAKKTKLVVYACAVLAILALLALIKFPQAATWLTSAVLLGNILSITLSFWTAQAGEYIRHPELRPPTPLNQPASTPSPATTINKPSEKLKIMLTDTSEGFFI